MSVHILSGVSGSGKSSLARSFRGTVVSADDFFMVDGEYRFDATKLSLAHGSCFRTFIRLLDNRDATVIVDNTNTTAVEIAPYALGAAALGHSFRVLTLMCRTGKDLLLCAERNTHCVPLDAIKAQHERLMRREFPPWWPHMSRHL